MRFQLAKANSRSSFLLVFHVAWPFERRDRAEVPHAFQIDLTVRGQWGVPRLRRGRGRGRRPRLGRNRSEIGTRPTRQPQARRPKRAIDDTSDPPSFTGLNIAAREGPPGLRFARTSNRRPASPTVDQASTRPSKACAPGPRVGASLELRHAPREQHAQARNRTP